MAFSGQETGSGDKRKFGDNSSGFRKRHRPIEFDAVDEGDALETKIARLGESLARDVSLEEQIDDMCRQLQRELSSNRNNIIRIIIECASELPEKTSIYAALVGLLNVFSYDLGGEIVEAAIQALKDYLRKNKWNEARFLVRFCADLVNCHAVSPGSLINLLESLVDVTQEEGIPQVRSDFYVFTVLSCLPWVGKELSEKKETDLDSLLSSIEEYMARRNKGFIQSLKVWHTDTPLPQEDYLDSLWAQISKLRSSKWVEHHIIRVYHAFGGTLEESALQHNLPQFLPPGHEPTYVYPYPMVVFRLFDYTDCPEGTVLPGAHAIERFLAEESIRNLINLFYFNRKDCAKHLLQCPVIQRYPIDYMLVEVILGEMFRLPKSTHIEIFYGSLMIELCKLQSTSLPMVLAQAVVLIYDRMASMNGGCIDKFSSWFAYHLSNFQFAWTWNDWESDANLEPLHPKIFFIRETFLRCLRFSYYQRVCDFVPETFKSLLPQDPKPIEKFAGDDLSSRLLDIAVQLKANFIAKEYDKCPPLDNLPPIEGFEGDAAKVNLVVNVLLNSACQSFTHLFTALGKSSNLLGDLITNDETQVALLHTLYEVWNKHQQLVVIVVSKIIKYGIIDAAAVIDWVFSPRMRDDVLKCFIWEIINNVIKRKLALVKEAEDNLAAEKEKLKKFESGDDYVISDNPDEIPSEESVEKLEEQLETCHADVKSIIQLILNRLNGMIMQHIRDSEAEGRSFKNHWFRWMIFRLQNILFEVSFPFVDEVNQLTSLLDSSIQYHEVIFKNRRFFETTVFTPDLHQHIQSIFKQFISLRS